MKMTMTYTKAKKGIIQNRFRLMMAITAVLLISTMIFTPSTSFALMYKSLNGLGGPGNFQYISGTIATPSPTCSSNCHKDYMIYVADSLTGFTAGAGIYYQKTSTGTISCFLRLYANDPNPSPTNFHWVTCSPSPSGNVAVKVEQTTDNGNTWKGTSGAYTQTYTYTNPDNPPNPPYFGSVAGSTLNDTNLYSNMFTLKTKKWGSAEQDFSATTTNQKCFTNSGYNFDYNTNVNNVRTGPPTITWQECTQQQEDYRPHGEWD